MGYPDPVLDAATRAAVDATGASRGWLLAAEGDGGRVVAAVGGDVPPAVVGTQMAAPSGVAGLVFGSGQPMALVARPDDPRFGEGVAAMLGVRPGAVLCVPCGDDDVLGVLELIDKAGGASFTFDDVEVATLVAGIAGAALGGERASASVPSPRELEVELERLAGADPAQYARLATLVDTLLSRA